LLRDVDEEVAAFLGRARDERTAEAKGSRTGTRPKPIQTAEGELSIAMPQVRNTGTLRLWTRSGYAHHRAILDEGVDTLQREHDNLRAIRTTTATESRCTVQ
jgi:hypothetical protein